MGEKIPDYVNSLMREIKNVGLIIDGCYLFETIYFGGGTPSLLEIDQISQIINSLQKNLSVSSNPEITFEVNPGTVSKDYLKTLFSLGINRLSIGAQSVKEEELKLLGRIHSNQDTRNSIIWAKEAGFDNFSLDLIFGIPRQTMRDWMNSIHSLLAFQPTHLSLYALTIEENTPMAKKVLKSDLACCSDDLAADMFEEAIGVLKANDYEHYEISNFHKNVNGINHKCLHNLRYWRNDDYIGVGAGAHSHYKQQRWENIENISEYIRASTMENFKNDLFAKTKISNNSTMAEMQETMMLGLRLIGEGVSKRDFFNRYHEKMEIQFGKEIEYLIQSGLVTWVGENLQLTKRGIMLGNLVFMQFVT